MANYLDFEDQGAIQAEKELGTVKELDALIQEIQKRAKLFVENIIPAPTRDNYMVIESAMLIGASIAIDQELANKKSKKS